MSKNLKQVPYQPYIGRFAPSPTGSLHFGSLIAAVASYLCARQYSSSQWLLRIEDIDTQREQAGATKSIIDTLEAYGFEWDGEITYQSQRNHYYQEALHSLGGLAYICSCSRKDLQAFNTTSQYGYRYTGLCREGVKNPNVKNPSIRIKTNKKTICFDDECQSESLCQSIESDVGDFILKRRDGLIAYQLAVVVDDHLQAVNHVARGADLFDNTPRQIYLQQTLGFKTPNYLHFPVAITSDGKKLSKQNHSPELSNENTAVKIQTLVNAMNFLGQTQISASDFSKVDDFWSWAKTHWCSDNIPKTSQILFQKS